MAFGSVFVDGKISNPATGNVINLRLIGEETLPYLESISIDLERGANLNIGMTFAPPYEKALELISRDNEWLRLGNTLGLRWGYADIPGAITDWYYGFMQLPEASFGDEISISVSATLLAWHADRTERTRDWCEVLPMSFRDIAEKIATKYGLEVEWGDDLFSHIARKLVDEPRQSFVQGGRTDLQFLMSEAAMIGLRMISMNHILYFVDAAAPFSEYPNVNAIFQMYGKMDISKNIYPMTSFAPQSMGALFIKDFQKVSAVAYGPNDDPSVIKEPVSIDDETGASMAFSGDKTVNSPPKQDGKPPVGMGDVKVKSIVKVDPSEDEGGRLLCLPVNGEETQDYFKGIVSGVNEATADDHGITVDFSCFAIPNILPGMFVGLEGVGDYFSGTYMLNKVSISVDSGGADMECEAFARGFPGINEQIDPFAAQVPLKKPVDGSLDDLLFTEEVLSEPQ